MCSIRIHNVQEESINVYRIGIDSNEGQPVPSDCAVLKSFTMKHATTELKVSSCCSR